MIRLFSAVVLVASFSAVQAHAKCAFLQSDADETTVFKKDSHGTSYFEKAALSFKTISQFSKFYSCLTSKNIDAVNKSLGRSACLIEDASHQFFIERTVNYNDVFVATSFPVSVDYTQSACLKTGSRGTDIPFYSESYSVCERSIDYKIHSTISSALEVSTHIEGDKTGITGWFFKKISLDEKASCTDETETVRKAVLDAEAKRLYSIEGRIYRLTDFDVQNNQAQFVTDADIEKESKPLNLSADQFEQAKRFRIYLNPSRGDVVVAPVSMGTFECYNGKQAYEGTFAASSEYKIIAEAEKSLDALEKTSFGRIVNAKGEKYATLVKTNEGKVQILFKNGSSANIAFYTSKSLPGYRFLDLNVDREGAVCIQK